MTASEIVKRRTTIYIERIEAGHLFVTPAGLDLPPGSVVVSTDQLPRSLHDPTAGKIFFANCNLNAHTADEAGLEAIEPTWGDTSALESEAGAQSASSNHYAELSDTDALLPYAVVGTYSGRVLARCRYASDAYALMRTKAIRNAYTAIHEASGKVIENPTAEPGDAPHVYGHGARVSELLFERKGKQA